MQRGASGSAQGPRGEEGTGRERANWVRPWKASASPWASETLPPECGARPGRPPLTGHRCGSAALEVPGVASWAALPGSWALSGQLTNAGWTPSSLWPSVARSPLWAYRPFPSQTSEVTDKTQYSFPSLSSLKNSLLV